MKHFGTDGIRALSEVFDREYLAKISLGIASLGDRMTIAIGRDPRISGKFIEKEVTATLLNHNVNVISVGMVPTPVLAFLTKFLGCNFGIMLSASHNPPQYNGIKLFSDQGEKVSEEVELKVEYGIENNVNVALGEGKFATYDGEEDYIDFVIDRLKPDLKGMKVLLDTANGATSNIAPRLFLRCGATVTQLKSETDGHNINDGCGATVPQFLSQKMKEGDYDIGFTYDGDGDRVMCVIDGKIYNGDHLMYVNCKDMKERGALVDNVMVGTVMSNLGTQKACVNAGIKLVRAGVGDKLVFREMIEHGYNVGGEESGHIIFCDVLRTGDGMIASLITTMLHQRKPINLLDDIIECPSVSDCIMCNAEQVARFKKSLRIKEYLQNIGEEYRTVIRPSGTEPKIRILVEAESLTLARQKASEIKGFIEEIIL